MVSTLTVGGTPYPITCPSQASGAGFSTLIFSDEFGSLSTIDVTNGGAAGFNWYLSHAWPTYNQTAPGGWKTFNPQLSGNISIVDTANAPQHSNLLTSAVPSDCLLSIMSAAYKASAPGYVGNIIGPGFYVEVRQKWSGTATFDGVGVWLGSMGVWLGTNADKISFEIDMANSFSSSQYHATILKWSGDPNSSSPILDTVDTGTVFSNAVKTDEYHVLGFLWQTISQGGGTGKVAYYLDNVLQRQITYTNAAGDFARMEQEQYAIVTNGPTIQYLDWIRVWR